MILCNTSDIFKPLILRERFTMQSLEFLNVLNIDQWIVVATLVGALAIGIIAGLKVKTLQQYALGGEKGSVPTEIIAMTLIATMIGAGSSIGNVTAIFNYGAVLIIYNIAWLIGILFIARFVASKFDCRFAGAFSSADIINKFYGLKQARFTAITSVIFTICIVGAQLTALGALTSDLLGCDYTTAVFISSSIVIFYSAFGGMRSVALTDVMQIFLLGIGLPTVGAILFAKAGGSLSELISLLPESHTQITEHEDFNGYLALSMLYMLPFVALWPALIQRYLMAKNTKQISKITYGYAFVYISLVFICVCTAFSALKILPDVEPNNILPYAIKEYLPIGLKGVAMAGLLAVVMSTVDSVLNSAGIMMVLNTFFNPNRAEIKKIRLIQLCTALIGAMSVTIALLNLPIYLLIQISSVLLITTSSAAVHEDYRLGCAPQAVQCCSIIWYDWLFSSYIIS